MAARSAYKFGQNLKELRIHLCQKSTASKGVRLVNNLISNLVFANKVFYFIMTWKENLCFYLSDNIASFFLYFSDFIENHYVSLKKTNPQFPILIRECGDVSPVVWARYGNFIFNPYSINFSIFYISILKTENLGLNKEYGDDKITFALIDRLFFYSIWKGNECFFS